MSWQAVTWVLEQSEAELGSRLVLLSIASHANREGKNAYPSLDTIARESLLSRREVIYCIQALEEKGELQVTRGIGRGNPNVYVLPLVLRWLEKVQSLHYLEKEKGATKKLKGAICNTKRCNDLALNPKESETSSEERLEPSKVRTVIEDSANSVIPEPSNSKSFYELKAEQERQLKALREKGFIQ